MTGEAASQSKQKRFHWTTVLVLLLMASIFAVWQVRGVHVLTRSFLTWNGPGPPDTDWRGTDWKHGWPAPFLMRQVNFPLSDNPTEIGPWNLTKGVMLFRQKALVLDVVVCLVLLAFVAVATEMLLRRHRLQFGMRSLFVVTAVAAVVSTLVVRRIIDRQHLILIPVGFSFMCLLGVLGWLILRGSRAIRHGLRP